MKFLSRVTTTAAAVLLAGLTLTGCSQISAGTITGKVREPAHTTTTQSCSTVNNSTICTPITTHDDEDWRFDISTAGKSGWVYVTETEFDQYDVGDFYGTLPVN